MATKITRLNDPANPYGGKKTPTAAPTAVQQATNRVASQRVPVPAKTKAVVVKPVVSPMMKRANANAMGSRKAVIDNAVEGKTRKK